MTVKKPGGVHRAKQKVFVSELMREDIVEETRHHHAATHTAAQLGVMASAAVAAAKADSPTVSKYRREKTKLDHYRGNNKVPGKGSVRWTDLDEGSNYIDPAGNFAEHPFTNENLIKLLGFRPVEGLQGWEYARQVGKGGYGSAHMFLKRDAGENVMDRMIVKESTIIGNNNIREYQIHKRVSDDAHWTEGTVQVPKLRGSTRNVLRPNYAIIRQEFAPNGDLWRLCHWYWKMRRIIPEPFIWHAFWSLVKACCVMQYGWDNPNRREPVQPNAWIQNPGFVVHLDMKMDNIFLANCETAATNPALRFPWTQHYPRILLADWGLSRDYLPADPGNPGNVAGTAKGYMAPEHHLQDLDPPAPTTGGPGGANRTLPSPVDREMSSATNIWSVGQVVWHLMQPDMLEVWDNHRDDPFHMQHELYDKEHFPGRYSSELSDLVFACMRFLPANRIGLDQLHTRVEQAMLRLNGTDWTKTPLPRLVYPPDHYPLGDTVLTERDYKIPVDRETVFKPPRKILGMKRRR